MGAMNRAKEAKQRAMVKMEHHVIRAADVDGSSNAVETRISVNASRVKMEAMATKRMAKMAPMAIAIVHENHAFDHAIGQTPTRAAVAIRWVYFNQCN